MVGLCCRMVGQLRYVSFKYLMQLALSSGILFVGEQRVLWFGTGLGLKGNTMRQVILIPDREVGGFTVTVPGLPGCISEGDTEEEALANIKDAIDLFIEDMLADGEEVPHRWS